MRKIIIFIALMLLVSAVGFGQAKMTVEQTLTKIEKDVADGLVKGDISVFEKYFAATAVVTDPGGLTMTRAESITLFKSGDLKFQSMMVEDVKVQLYGNTAIVTYRTIDKGTFKGQAFTGKHRWTDTFIKLKGKWLIVAAHGTPIMEMTMEQKQ